MKLPPSMRRLFPTLAAVALLIAMAFACAPASGSVGIEVGSQSPPFAMTLSDGSEVTSASLDEADQPVHLFWFATW